MPTALKAEEVQLKEVNQEQDLNVIEENNEKDISQNQL